MTNIKWVNFLMILHFEVVAVFFEWIS